MEFLDNLIFDEATKIRFVRMKSDEVIKSADNKEDETS